MKELASVHSTIRTALLITATIIVLAVTVSEAFPAPPAIFSTDEFDGFTLHTYAGFDAMADVSFIVESEHKLVVIEPQAFKGKVEEFTTYTEKLGKPIDKVLVSFHPAGLKVYMDERKVISKPMAEFLKTDAAKGMLGYFDKAFGGAMDTEVVAFDEFIDANATFMVDGVAYELEPTSLPGMPGVNISIGNQVYYQHFAPAKGLHASKNQIKSKSSIDGALADAVKAKSGGYKLLLGSHGYGKANAEDLEFQIEYLKVMGKIADEAGTADEFIARMNVEYPTCQGMEDLAGIAEDIYK